MSGSKSVPPTTARLTIFVHRDSGDHEGHYVYGYSCSSDDGLVLPRDGVRLLAAPGSQGQQYIRT